MGLIGYTTGIPNGPNNPSNDQPDMKTNNDNIAKYVAIDHVAFGVNNSGYHKIIHQGSQGTWNPVTRTGAPAPIAGIEQTFPLLYTPDSTGATADTQLFSITGGGGVSQLTGSASQNEGWQWIGGVLLQWGQVLNPGTSGTVTFKDRVPGSTIRFPIAVFNVQLTLQRTSANQTVTIDNAVPPTATGFGYLTSSAGSNVLYWFAIGW